MEPQKGESNWKYKHCFFEKSIEYYETRMIPSCSISSWFSGTGGTTHPNVFSSGDIFDFIQFFCFFSIKFFHKFSHNFVSSAYELEPRIRDGV